MALYYRALILVEHYGSFDSALLDLNRVLALAPDHTDSRYLLGKAHQLQGNLNASMVEFERVIALDGQHSGALFHLAEIKEVTGDMEAAIQYYSLSIEVEPGEPQAYNRLAALLLRYERFDEAVGVLERGLGHTENSVLANQLGQALRSNDQLERSIGYLRTAVALDEGSLGYLYDLGLTLYEHYRQTGLASYRTEAIQYLHMTHQHCTQNESGLHCEQIAQLLNRLQDEAVEEVLPQ
jgi:tetratricopeptide (TPR) repeat protein